MQSIEQIPLVCTVVLAYGSSPSDLIDCLESLRNQTGVRQSIGVIQNGAPNDLMTRIEERFQWIHLIRNGQNVGAAAGRNIGIAWAESCHPDYLFFADNDATFAPNALQELIHSARSNPQAGFLGCVLYRKNEPGVVFSAGARMHTPLIEDHLLVIDPTRQVIQVDFVGSGAMLVPVETIRQIGRMDEGLFVYYEDADWCLRGQKAGLDTLVVTASAAFHDVPRGKINPRHVYYTTRNRLVVARRHGFFASLRERSVLVQIFSNAVRLALADDDLALTCAFAYSVAVIHAWRGRLGRCPDAFDRRNDIFLEGRLRRRIRATRLWHLMRQIKHLAIRPFSAGHAA
jgi:GT2 family glycosyltransferase